MSVRQTSTLRPAFGLYTMLLVLVLVGCGTSTSVTSTSVPATSAVSTPGTPHPTEMVPATESLPPSTGEVPVTATAAGTATPSPTPDTSFIKLPPEPTRPSAVEIAPVRIEIPRIGVDAEIEHVGKTKDGKMAVPEQVHDVAWYRLGAVPGERGNAVISGHFDDYKGDPAVFWDLGKLNAGDTIIVTNNDGSQQRFRVREAAMYPFDRAPLRDIFGYTPDRQLNLITCDGAWNEATRNYSQRLVVYTYLISD